jgi:vitamin B12 transporter
MSTVSVIIRALAIAAVPAGFALGIGKASAQQQLEGVVVEAAGLEPVQADKVGSAYTVITGEELERRQIRHAADALRFVPGVQVSAAGGQGSFTQLRIRGGEANQTVVLIDGVEVNSLDAGDFDFSTLLTADIERIEVIRGPQSGVFGANALAGVVNIITRKGAGPARASATAEAGSFNSHMLSANASGGSDKGYLSVTAGTAKTDGFNISRFGSEDDGSEQKSFFARGGLRPSDVFRVDFMLRYQRNETDIDQDLFDANFASDGLLDDTPGDVNTREQRMARIAAELDTFDKHWTHKVFLNYLEDDFFSTSELSESESTNLGERRHFGYQSTVSFSTPDILAAEHKITGLIEHKQESFSSEFLSPSFTSAGEAERKQTGFVTEYQGTFFRDLTLIGNIRRDKNETFDDATTYRIAAALSLPDSAVRLHTSYGKGVTNPTFFEQFGFALNFQGNPDLTPEESKGWDVGVEKRWLGDRLIADLTFFRANLLNEIVGFGETVINQSGESQRQGVELQLSAKPVDGVTITASYTYTDSEDPDGAQEIRRPKHAASLNAGYSFAGGKGQLDIGVIYNGKMKDDIFSFPISSSTLLGDYVLVNIAASYKLDERITLFGRVQNLLDEDYEEVYGFATAPITAYAGLKLSFQDDAPLEPAMK